MSSPPSKQPGLDSRELVLIDQLRRNNSASLLRALGRMLMPAGVSTLEQFMSDNSFSAVSRPSTSRLALDSSDEVSEINTLGTVPTPENLPPKAALYRKPVQAGEIYIVKRFNSRQHCWGLAKVLAIICNVQGGVQKNRCLVGFSDSSTQKRPVEAEEMAYHDTCDTIIPKSSGVVSNSIDSNKCNYYPGVIIETPEPLNRFRYLVLFDRGDLRYCNHHELHVICDVYQTRASKTDQFWVKDALFHSDQFMLKFQLGQTVTVFINETTPRKGKSEFYDQTSDIMKFIENAKRNKSLQHFKHWREGTIKEIDCSIVRLEFSSGDTGWYHRGSYYFLRFIACDLPPHMMRTNHKRRHLSQIQNAYRQAFGPNATPQQLSLTCSNGAIVPAAGTSLQLGVPKPSTSMPRPTSIDARLQYSSTLHTTRLIPLLVVKPKKLGFHICNSGCVPSERFIAEIDSDYSPLVKPFSVGFQRTTSMGAVRYTAPCGRSVRNVADLTSFFDQTNIAFSHINFDFSPNIDPLRIFQLEQDCILSQKYDITDGLENHPIPCVNEVNNTLPDPVKYITKRRLMTPLSSTINHENFLSCCTCTDDCKDTTKCECSLLTVNSYLEILPYENKRLKPDEVLYKQKRLLNRVRSGIFECNSKCQCSSKCGNRLAQFPMSCKLQLFLTPTKGWGVRTLHDIPKGSFICTYVGILLNELEANEWGVLHGDQYLMDLDYIKVQEGYKPDYEEEAPPLSFDEDEEDAADLSIDLEKQRKIDEIAAKLRKRIGERPTWTPRRKKKKKKKPGKPRYPMNSLRYLFPLDQAEYVIDAKTSGNVGRYFNHSCEPNMFVQNVFINTHDLRFPEISFFTNKDVYAGTELTWDYNYDIGSVSGGKRLYCLCLAPSCRIRLY